MKKFKSIDIFYIATMILIVYTFFAYTKFTTNRDFVKNNTLESSIVETNSILKNISKYYVNNLSQLDDDDLYDKFSAYLNSFETTQYKNIFAVNVVQNKLFVVADGSSNQSDKFHQNELFIPISNKWKDCIELQNPIYFKQNLNDLWMTYLYPIVKDNKVVKIIAIDQSMKSYNALVLKQTIISKHFLISISIVIFMLMVLMLFLYHQSQVKKKEEKYIMQEHKHAQIGRIIDSIAHQWIQPLQAIKTISELYLLKISKNIKMNKSETVDDLSDIVSQADFALETLDEFRSFLSENKKTEYLSIGSVIESSLSILEDVIVHNRIQTKIVGDTLLKVDIYKNEFKHVLINLIQNSKDAFITNKIKNRNIIFIVETIGDYTVLKIIDNAGGINENLLKNIFDLDISTKKDTTTTTTGMGLYMTKQILNKIGANIKAYNNTDGGATFEIKI